MTKSCTICRSSVSVGSIDGEVDGLYEGNELVEGDVEGDVDGDELGRGLTVGKTEGEEFSTAEGVALGVSVMRLFGGESVGKNELGDSKPLSGEKLEDVDGAFVGKELGVLL